MGKQTYGHTYDKKTKKVIVVNQTMTKDQAKSTELIGWSKGPGKSPVKRAMRNLFG